MKKGKYSNLEQQFNNVLNYQTKTLHSIKSLDVELMEGDIAEREATLASLGISTDCLPKSNLNNAKKAIVVPTWEELCTQAERNVGSKTDLESLFTEDELITNKRVVRILNNEYNSIHKLDKIDISICVGAGLLGLIIDILLVGIPHKTSEGLKADPLSNYVRDWFNQKYPKEEMEKLANSKISKVSYDAQDNRHTKEYVDGLSAYYHRLLSLGHDPFLGLIVGVYDILNGKMTTVDKTGKVVSQAMKNYSDRKESDIFAAIAKQLIHFKSDITTSMGLPVPLMALFNLFQFGSVGEEDQIIAEIVQGMYYEGYDFIYFCSMSVPSMIVEVIIRIAYSLKRIKEGYSIKESIPFSLNREKHPKLATLLFISYSATTAINAGKIYFTKNPMAINYSQWLAFAKYSYKQLKWALFEKAELRDKYVRGVILDELTEVYAEIDKRFEEVTEKYTVVFN